MAITNNSANFQHGTPLRFGVLLLNLGTPDAPTPSAVRKYLAEFLSDSRVVEIPPIAWKLILHGIILRTRPAKSAKKYAGVWTKEGSPLMVWSTKQAQLLQGALGEAMRVRGLDPAPMKVALGMRYGNPSIPKAIDELMAQGCDKILVMPLYPQYAASTTGSGYDGVFRHVMKLRNAPAIRTMRGYHDDPRYISALVKRVEEYWKLHGRPDTLVLSFHGVPKFSLDKGDPYHCLCLKTARLLKEGLQVAPQVITTFQSRFGKAEWLKPYTSEVLTDLGKRGTHRVDVFCPGFPADCLETLEEMADEGKETFLHAGGKLFHYIPALNDSMDWIHALTAMTMDELGNWLDTKIDQKELVNQKDASKALGAPR
jgi:protoporphyrin/coproporphyrin ferrochelatase